MNKISILMPIFDEEKYISQSIDSVLDQSYKNFELIIIDDFSIDSSYDICNSYANKDNRIKLIKNINKGKISAFNLAYKNSNGDFICYFAGDDIMNQESLSNRVANILHEINNPIACTSRVKTISKINKFDNINIPKNKKKGTLLGGCVMFNKVLGDKIFPIPVELPNEDKWTALHMTFFSDIIHVPFISLLYRIHSKNSSSRIKSFDIKNIEMHNRFIVYSLFLNKYRKNLDDKSIKFLEGMCCAEELRYKSKIIELLGVSIPFKEKIRLIFHSNKFLYSLRINFFSFFSGWG